MTTTIFHVPGHGGDDAGTSHGGLVESDWVLAQAIACETALAALGIPQAMSRRDGSINPTMQQEADGAIAAGAGLAILHHVNAAASPSASGLMVFARRGDSVSIEVGDAIVRACPFPLRRRLGKCTLVSTNDPQYPRVANCLMRYTVPAVLIEYGFASRESDRIYLMRHQSHTSLVACVMAGAGRFLEGQP
jgi:N-acetylmuramoyl-L-alanine amidase